MKYNTHKRTLKHHIFKSEKGKNKNHNIYHFTIVKKIPSNTPVWN
jgi:hypothetical protein